MSGIGLRPVRLLCLVVAGMMVTPVAIQAEPRHRLACPPVAPAEWRMRGPAPLEQPAVLSQPVGQAIDDSAPPSLVPDRGFARGNVWHNVWIMGDEPGWSHYVDCQYRGSKRILRLKADGLKTCEQMASPYSDRTGVAANAVQTMVCD